MPTEFIDAREANRLTREGFTEAYVGGGYHRDGTPFVGLSINHGSVHIMSLESAAELAENLMLACVLTLGEEPECDSRYAPSNVLSNVTNADEPRHRSDLSITSAEVSPTHQPSGSAEAASSHSVTSSDSFPVPSDRLL